MRLYTLQHHTVVEILYSAGIYRARWESCLWSRQRPAYEWMVAQMALRGISCGGAAPVWAWHSCGGWQQAPRQADIDALLGFEWAEEGCWQWIEFEAPATQALLSSYRYWGIRFDAEDLADYRLNEAQYAARCFDINTVDLRQDQIQASLPFLKLEWLRDNQPLTAVYPLLEQAE